jgi:ferredoxin
MKARVDESLCIGCELCVQLCPGVFRMEGDYAAVISEAVPLEHEKAAR